MLDQLDNMTVGWTLAFFGAVGLFVVLLDAWIERKKPRCKD